MPIEIKEMHIKINVSEKTAPKNNVSTDQSGKLVQDCLDQMTRLLNDKDER
ncbi:MAG: hypothetical protein Crog4KO_05780 [Crocinitomicaceae bacterium]